MFKKLIIILAILQMNLAFAADNTQVHAKDPGDAALHIMMDALSAFKKLRASESDSMENTKKLVRTKIMPFIAINTSAKIALKDHWEKLTPAQQKMFARYITQSIMKDYVGMLHSYQRIGNLSISIGKNIKRKGNKALVKLRIKPNKKTNKVVIVLLKMIKVTNQWSVYDLAFSGVSLVKTYQAQFHSHIKRKGLDHLIEEISKKL